MSTRAGLARGGGRIGSTRRILRDRDGDLCGRCVTPIDFNVDGMAPDGPTIGHVIPAADGGTDELANLRLEHRRCNLAAGDRPTPPRALIARPLEIDTGGGATIKAEPLPGERLRLTIVPDRGQ